MARTFKLFRFGSGCWENRKKQNPQEVFLRVCRVLLMCLDYYFLNSIDVEITCEEEGTSADASNNNFLLVSSFMV